MLGVPASWGRSSRSAACIRRRGWCSTCRPSPFLQGQLTRRAMRAPDGRRRRSRRARRTCRRWWRLVHLLPPVAVCTVSERAMREPAASMMASHSPATAGCQTAPRGFPWRSAAPRPGGRPRRWQRRVGKRRPGAGTAAAAGPCPAPPCPDARAVPAHRGDGHVLIPARGAHAPSISAGAATPALAWSMIHWRSSG